MNGKDALVTGTGSGIGKGCALMFARHGAKVMGCDIHPASAEDGLKDCVCRRKRPDCGPGTEQWN